MPRFAPKWPQEIRDAIADASAAKSLKTERIFEQVRSGKLPGLSKAYPELPSSDLLRVPLQGALGSAPPIPAVK